MDYSPNSCLNPSYEGFVNPSGTTGFEASTSSFTSHLFISLRLYSLSLLPLPHPSCLISSSLYVVSLCHLRLLLVISALNRKTERFSEVTITLWMLVTQIEKDFLHPIEERDITYQNGEKDVHP
ncbi:unnamed protein product [Prunus armeniaca]